MMARKDTPWQADFNQEDKARVFRWILSSNLSPWDRWGRDLIEIAERKADPTFALPLCVKRGGGAFSIHFTCKDPKLPAPRARRMLRELGFPNDFIDSYCRERGEFLRRCSIITEDQVFSNMWLNLTNAGAGVNLHKILTSDKASALRWKKQLKEAGKTWADVRMSAKAASDIGVMLIDEFGRYAKSPLQRNSGALRTRFRRYAKKYFSGGGAA